MKLCQLTAAKMRKSRKKKAADQSVVALNRLGHGEFVKFPCPHSCVKEERCVSRLQVTRDGIPLGHHKLTLHSEGLAFSVTAFDEGAVAHESQLRRLLDVLPIHAWQWINIHHTEMKFVTVVK